MILPMDLEAYYGIEALLANEYNRTGKVEGYEVELERGCLTLYPLDGSGELSITIEGGHEYET